MKPFFSLLALLLGAFAASIVSACSSEQAFGFRFGHPVPAQATSVKEILFQGGTDLVSFSAPVPTPLAGFSQYTYWSNKDRRAVYSINAYTPLIADADQLQDASIRQAVLDKARIEIARLRQEWQDLYGFQYVQASDSGLKWRAEKDGVSTTIGVMAAQYLYIDCVNIQLESQALSKALNP